MSAREVVPLRVGVLGAARIVREALLTPARRLDGVEVTAIAARDPQRAQHYARNHDIRRVHASYEALLADPSIDAVYLPLPSALHEEWVTAAIEAGKHVLVEKPFTSNAAAADRVAQRAEAASTVVMEAYHSAHHPLQQQLRGIISSGTLGTVTAARAVFCAPIPPGRDIRWNLALGGGGLLDVGYYPLRQLRDLFGEIAIVSSAQGIERGGIDRLLTASVELESGVRAQIVSSMWSRHLMSMSLIVVGTAATMRVSWPYHPQQGSKIRVDGPGVRLRDRADRESSYSYQLGAFRNAVQGEGPVLTDARAGAAQMRSIDRLYAAAGMRPRP